MTEATYAAYALWVWLSGRAPLVARRFARVSAIGSLVFCAAGQVPRRHAPRAYYAAGLGHPDKPNQQIEFGGTMARCPASVPGTSTEQRGRGLCGGRPRRDRAA